MGVLSTPSLTGSYQVPFEKYIVPRYWLTHKAVCSFFIAIYFWKLCWYIPMVTFGHWSSVLSFDYTLWFYHFQWLLTYLMSWYASLCQVLTNFGKKIKRIKMRKHWLTEPNAGRPRMPLLRNCMNRNWVSLGLFLWPLLLYLDEFRSYTYSNMQRRYSCHVINSWGICIQLKTWSSSYKFLWILTYVII